MPIIVKLKFLVRSIGPLSALMQSKSFHVTTIWRLSKIGEKVQEEADRFQKAKTEKIKRSGAKLQKEKVGTPEERAWWDFGGDQALEDTINEEIEQLLEEEVSLELNQCSLKELVCPDLTPGVLMSLLWLVREPTEGELELLEEARVREPESSGDQRKVLTEE